MSIEKIEGCIGCRACVEACPMDVLRFDEDKKSSVITYPQDCQVCRLCQQYCPANAITITDDRTIPVMKAWG